VTPKLRDLEALASKAFGWASLTDEQRVAIEQLLKGNDVLAVLPTGAGKSAVYQLPALVLDGPTVVVSPLLALQYDQIRSLGEAKVPDAVAVNSAESTRERAAAWRAVKDGDAEYLFLSPEQLAKESVVAELAALSVGLFVVDEAHCVSAWGHDFRPDYLRLAPVIERLGHPPVVALTATAALPVRQDIVARLGLRNPQVVSASFDRPNLRLSVEYGTDAEHRRNAALATITALTADPATRRGLVYVASRKDTDAYADDLAASGIRVAGYHAGMKRDERTDVQDRFMNDDLDVVAATSAFGMGIDKPDVRFVVHATAPESLDSYYQQIGRAGRDGEPAEIVLHYRPEDLHLQRFLTAHRAPEQALRDVAQALLDAGAPMTSRELGEQISAGRVQRTRAINLLEQAGAIGTDGRGRFRYLDRGRSVPDAVEQATATAETHQELIRSRIEMMRGYAETTGCRRQFLLSYFGEQLLDPCGNCDNCSAGTATALPTDEGAIRPNAAVEHERFGTGVVMSVESDRATVLFQAAGYKTIALSADDGDSPLQRAGSPQVA
jgi:ATP-dependent DNA helicase RecQ